MDDRIANLRATTLLSSWSNADLTALAACADQLSVAAGEIIEKDAYAYRWWWMVVDGSVAVAVDGKPATVLGPGHAVGLDCPEHSTDRLTLTALGDVTMLVSCRQVIKGAADTHPRIGELVRQSLGH